MGWEVGRQERKRGRETLRETPRVTPRDDEKHLEKHLGEEGTGREGVVGGRMMPTCPTMTNWTGTQKGHTQI